MKRANHLFEQASMLSNIELAFYKASKGKRNRKEVIMWQKDLDYHIQNLSKEMKEGKVSVGDYQYFTIHDPKKRIICVASFKERVYQHALMNVCHNYFENFQIDQSYATRINKGTHEALRQTLRYNVSAKWFLKLDVYKFFDTVDHKKLKQLLERRFKEKKMLNAFFQILDSYNIHTQKGLPIGNLTSQYFANFYLAFLDRYAKEQLKIKKYVRYMDDILVWTNSKSQMWYFYCQMKKYLQNELNQIFKTPTFNKTDFSFVYLGYLVSRDKISPNKKNKIKFMKRTKELEKWKERHIITEESALTAFWSMYNYRNFEPNAYV